MSQSEPEATQTVDVRKVPPAQRHPLIFGTFEKLRPGQEFVLINDHDPKPLYNQFQAEHAGQDDSVNTAQREGGRMNPI